MKILNKLTIITLLICGRTALAQAPLIRQDPEMLVKQAARLTATPENIATIQSYIEAVEPRGRNYQQDLNKLRAILRQRRAELAAARGAAGEEAVIAEPGQPAPSEAPAPASRQTRPTTTIQERRRAAPVALATLPGEEPAVPAAPIAPATLPTISRPPVPARRPVPAEPIPATLPTITRTPSEVSQVPSPAGSQVPSPAGSQVPSPELQLPSITDLLARASIKQDLQAQIQTLFNELYADLQGRAQYIARLRENPESEEQGSTAYRALQQELSLLALKYADFEKLVALIDKAGKTEANDALKKALKDLFINISPEIAEVIRRAEAQLAGPSASSSAGSQVSLPGSLRSQVSLPGSPRSQVPSPAGSAVLAPAIDFGGYKPLEGDDRDDAINAVFTAMVEFIRSAGDKWEMPVRKEMEAIESSIATIEPTTPENNVRIAQLRIGASLWIQAVEVLHQTPPPALLALETKITGTAQTSTSRAALPAFDGLRKVLFELMRKAK